MKKIIMNVLSFVTAIVFVSLMAFAETATVDGVEWNYTVTGDGARLDGIKTSVLSGTELVTPKTIGGKTVTAIGSSCFEGRDTLTAVTISEGVETIESSPFPGCSRLKIISLPSTLKSISGSLGGKIHPTTILFPKGNSSFSVSGGFLYSKTDMTLHCLLDVETAIVPSGVTTIPSYIGYYSNIKSLVVSQGVTSIGEYAFNDACYLKSLSLPETLETIGSYAFASLGRSMRSMSCSRVSIPSSVTSIENNAFYQCSIDTVEFMGCPFLENYSFYGCGCNFIFHAQAPANLSAADVVSSAQTVSYPKEYAAQYAAVFDETKFAGYTNPDTCSVEVKSAKMRSDDPTIMDVTFRVTSSKPTVKVRAVAFANESHTLEHAVRIKSYSDNFGSSLGDAVTANEDHSFAWKVSDDFTNKVATLSVEVLAVTDGALPFEFVTIPASGTQPELTIARNAISQSRWDDAVLWAFADTTATWAKVTCTEGWNGSGYTYTYQAVTDTGDVIYSDSDLGKLYFKLMGFEAATDEQIAYAREKTGYSLSANIKCTYYYRSDNGGLGSRNDTSVSMPYAVKK